MNRKKFFKSLGFGLAGSYLLPKNIFSKNNGSRPENKIFDEWINTFHSFSGKKITISSNEIFNDLKFVHITDSHLSVLKNGRSEYPEYTKRMDGAYLEPKHFVTSKRGSKIFHFEYIIDNAKKENVDFLILTGDILNNPSIYNVDYLIQTLENSGLEYFYTAGNHDWHFEGMKGKLTNLRDEWIDKRLRPLYKGNNPLYYSRIIKEINFIFLDDSTYQINKEQLNFFRNQVERDYPIILCMHIPVYQYEDKYNEELYTIGDPRWGYEYDYENYKTEKRERWPKEGNKKETLEFIIEVLSCKKLIAIFAGHDHAEKNRRISPSAYQYLTKASYNGSHRIVEIKKS